MKRMSELVLLPESSRIFLPKKPKVCIFHDLLRVSLELRLQGFAKAYGLGGDDVLQGAALGAGEHGGVDLFVNGLVIAEDQAAPGARRVLWVVEVTTSA